MPSPFPGMDPYLEDPAGWPGFHNALVVGIMGELNRRVTPKYFAQIEHRVYVSDQDDPGRRAFVPDVRVVRRGKGRRPSAPPAPDPPAGVAVCEPVTVTTVVEEEVRESFVTVTETASRNLVTVIEVLSPANKVAGSAGRAEFTRKRAAVLKSPASWVEIDLLRDGEPVHAEEPYPACEYTVHVSKAADRPQGRIWPIRLAQRLPVVRVPLRGADPDAPLDLQPLVDTVYDQGAYGLWVKYTADPVPPLPPDLAAWADDLLRGKKLR